MLTLAAVLFAAAALGGLALATMHIKRRGVPIPLALFHGALAATALVLLVLAVLRTQPAGLAIASIVLFAIAAIGGLVLFATHLRARPLPKPLIFLHGALAATAFVILLLFILR